MENLSSILFRKDESFYLPFNEVNFDLKTQEALNGTYRTSAVLIAKKSSIFKNIVKKDRILTSQLIEKEFSIETLEEVKAFTQKNFYEVFKDHYTNTEIIGELNGLNEYFEYCGAKGKIGYLDGSVISVLLFHDYNKHPALNNKTRHVGYWGYNSEKVSNNEAAFIKHSWISRLTSDLSHDDLIDCSIHMFNKKSLRFATNLGFQQVYWRFDRRKS